MKVMLNNFELIEYDKKAQLEFDAKNKQDSTSETEQIAYDNNDD